MSLLNPSRTVRGLLYKNIIRPRFQLRHWQRPAANLRFKSTSSRNTQLLKNLSEQNHDSTLDEDKATVPPKPEEELNLDSLAHHTTYIYNKLKPITPNDLYVSCTTFDKSGNITAISKKYPKMKFLKENNLFPRDLRKIDTSSIDVVPQIMVRSSNAILINLLHIKAIIKKDSVKVFDTSNPSIATKLGLFMYDLEMKLKMPSAVGSVNPSGHSVYEFRALESILISTMSYLEAEFKTHLSQCGMILSELEDQIDRNKLQDLLIKLKKLTSYYQKAALIRDVLEELLENDEDLAGMYLTNPKAYNPSTSSNEDDFEDLEMILESYYNHCDEFVQQAGSLINDIKATEEIVNIILDANRNSLMLFELKVTIYTLGFTVATLLPAFYGMNLKNYIEESNYGFGAVVVFSVIQGLMIIIMNFRKLSKVQKLTMMGGHGHLHYESGRSLKNAKNWFSRRLWYRILYGRRTRYDRPTSKEKDVIWRMINNDRHLR